MASVDDLASIQEELNLSVALQKRKSILTPRGSCWLEGCEEPLKGDLLFCGVECRDEWERIKKIRERQTGVRI